MADNTYAINYEDQRFQDVEADKKAALSENEKLYSGMVNETGKYYQAQVDASKEWEKTQTNLQNQQTDFAIEKIEQQKDQAKKDYTKEQSGAYQDWQKQSNKYGVASEQQAEQGLDKSGYSESSQVSMYNTYQNRVAKARESYNVAVLNYNNAIKDARLQNNSKLAEIAYQSLQTQLQLALEGFQAKNTLLLEQANKKIELEQMYHERWQDVLAQMNAENSLAEQVRQYNESMALEREQWEWQKAQAEAKSSGGGSSSGGSSRRYYNNPDGGYDDSDTKIEKDDGSDSSDNMTYSEAVKEMTSKGVDNSYASSIMTEREWQLRKESGSTKAETSHSSYSDYAKSAIAYNTDPAVKASRKAEEKKAETAKVIKNNKSILNSKSIFKRF